MRFDVRSAPVRPMAGAETVVVTRPKSKLITKTGKRAEPALDLVEQNFTADYPDRFRVADVTHTLILDGFAYVPVVRDVFSMQTVGWSMGLRWIASLMAGALDMALSHGARRDPPLRPVLAVHVGRVWGGLPGGGREYLDRLSG